jgi:epoxyqueuosine reductase QueG
VERFDDAPGGFHPVDIYNNCKSVVVFLKRMPEEIMNSGNPVIYTHTANYLYAFLDKIGMELCYSLEKQGIKAVPVPTDVPYMHWDQEQMRGMGILSLRHAAFNAGLGFPGRNTLLINPELGNLVYIGAILTESLLEPDPLLHDFQCPPNCRLCLDACSVQALDGFTVDQKKCRQHSILDHPRGWSIYTCSECRVVCPYLVGTNSEA